ncbi:unnamed protein product [Phyllotreta striolata]|uniref:Uncharacterized protein n=1 Tax=Phyllotreta striolata TaxID=444603 RepID=A0A9N9TQ14_PHYSR|nr:unnamed protein product [Phyllotreta striolata]
MKPKNGDVKRKRGFGPILYDTYKEFAENTSLHGLKYTVMKDIGKWEKTFWLLVLFFGFACAIYLTILFWGRYVSNPTRTTILSYYAPTTTIPFPAVSICNINRISKTKLDNFVDKLGIDDEEEKKILMDAVPKVLIISGQTGLYKRIDVEWAQIVLRRHNINNLTQFLGEVTHNCSETVMLCLWNEEILDCSQIFNEALTSNGFCCSFNYGDTKVKYATTEFNGVGSGLTVLLDPKIEKVQYSNYKSSGFKVIIHDPEEYPGGRATTRMITQGSVAYIQLFGSKMICSGAVKDLPISQRDCYYTDEMELGSFGEYTYSNCLTECEANYYYSKCNCVPYFYDFTDKTKCDVSSLTCIFDIRSDIANLSKICDCPTQCEDDFYDIVSEYSDFEYTKSMFMFSYENATIDNETILLNVFFNEQIQIVFMRDTIFSTIYLLSSFGGVYSLFLGCSLITIVEVLYYCTFRLFINMKHSSLTPADEKLFNSKQIYTIYKDRKNDFVPQFLP